MTSQLQCWVTMIQMNTYKVLSVRWLFSPQEGDITIRKSNSKTIFMKMKPHELDKPYSSYGQLYVRAIDVISFEVALK